MARYSRDDVVAALEGGAILEHYGQKFRRSGRWLRSTPCPGCGDGNSDALGIGTFGFRCHRCGCKGGLLDLIGLFEGLDMNRDFVRVLEAAAAIAGVDPEPGSAPSFGSVEQRARLARQAVERAARARREADEARQRLDAAAAVAQPAWASCARRSATGEAYLALRGLATLARRDDVVRFDDDGTIRVPLFHWDGRIVDVPSRYLTARGGKKTKAMYRSSTRGAFGGLHLITEVVDGPVVLVEGIFDYLTGRACWPMRAVLGAAGAGRLPEAAREIGKLLSATSRELLLVPHHDRAGLRESRAAMAAAIQAGLERTRIRLLDTRPGDLNDWFIQHRSPTASTTI